MHRNGASEREIQEGLRPNRALYGAAAFTYFSDSLLLSFLFPYAVVLGASFDQMGLMRSVRNLFQNVLQVGWGEVSERFSRRILVAIGYLSSGCLIIAILLSRESTHLLILIIAQSILWSAAVPAWSSLLADYTSLRTRGRVLGRIGAVSQFSGVIAALIVALATYAQPGEMTVFSFTIPFTLSAITALLGAILILLVKEARVERPVRGETGILAPLLDRNFRTFLIVNGFYWFTMAFAWPLFPYITINVVHATVWQIALISAVSGFVTSITQPKLGSIIDRFGRKPVLIISRLSFFLYPLVYGFATDWLQLLAINALLSVSNSAAMVSFSAYIMDSSPLGLRANYVASTNMIMGIATFLGSLTGGAFASQLSSSIGEEKALFVSLMLAALLRLISSLGLLLIKETLPKECSEKFGASRQFF
ncbi:MFS transporter [Candidatus Bathyarchaeota archaeon]|nr:MAG: MFS transporter [Candidatus Bathyarchaeota archaeon]